MSTFTRGRALPWPIIADPYGSSGESSRAAGEVPYPTDEDVMTRLQGNDSSALTCLYDRYSRIVLAVAFRILRDHGEAEEVVQEAFFQVFQKSSQFDPSKGSTKSWIIQIAFHRALDRKAFLARRGFYVSTNIDGMSEILSSATDLDREIGSRLNREQLDKAFQDLPAMQRRTLELFYFEGLQLCEITDKLDEPMGNIRHHFYRGLERLRKSAFVQKLREK
jgi:RNA polymerase sigma-70 factor (ECF subfamily)